MANKFKTGDRVRIVSYPLACFQVGEEGTVTSRRLASFDYEVSFDSERHELFLENELELAPAKFSRGDRVRITEYDSRPQYVGRVGVVTNPRPYDWGTYAVAIDAGETIYMYECELEAEVRGNSANPASLRVGDVVKATTVPVKVVRELKNGEVEIEYPSGNRSLLDVGEETFELIKRSENEYEVDALYEDRLGQIYKRKDGGWKSYAGTHYLDGTRGTPEKPVVRLYRATELPEQ